MEFYLSQNNIVPSSQKGMGYYTINLDRDRCFGSCDEFGNTDHLPSTKEEYDKGDIKVWFAITFDPALWKGETKMDGDVLLGRLLPS